MDKKWRVYKHTCIVECKYKDWVYIGITSYDEKRRWRSGGEGYKKQGKKQSLFYYCIQKYGWNEGFSHETLYENLTFEEACLKEKELIEKYNCLSPHGFNQTKGGEGVFGYKLSEADIETRRVSKMNSISKPILQISFEGKIIKEWRSCKEASKKTSYGVGSIHSCLKKTPKYWSAYGYFWVYKVDYDKGIFNLEFYQDKVKKRIIYQINKANEIVHTYDTLEEILTKNPSFNKASISMVLNKTPRHNKNGKTYLTKTSGGYVWRYEEDYQVDKDYSLYFNNYNKN